MLKEIIKDTVTERLGTLKTSPKGWHTRNCPMCHQRGHGHDTKGRFGIKFSPDGVIALHCFHCFFKSKYAPGNLLSKDFVLFLKVIGVPPADLKKLKFQAFREKEAGEIFAAPKLKGLISSKWKTITLPHESKPVSFWIERKYAHPDLDNVIAYAAERLVNTDHIYWTPQSEHQMKKRFILPFYHNNNIVGYTARYATELPNSSVPRYINNMPDSYVYNLDVQRDYNRKYCILHEGVLDAYVTDGISCLGSINQEQIDLINDLDKVVIVCPDREASGNHLVDAALEQGWNVAFPRWGRDVKDAGCASQLFGKILTTKSIIDSAESNPLKIQVSRKMDKF